MPDENSGSAAVAESSPAAEAPQTQTFEVPRDPAAYNQWRKTGEIPESKPKREAPAPSKKESSAAPEKEAGTSAASEAETQQERKPRSDAASRLDEILADLRRAGFTPAELKTYKREVQQQQQAKPEQTAKLPEAQQPDPGAPKKPKADDFKTWEEYEAAKDKYTEEIAEYKSQKAIENYRISQQQEAAAARAKERFADAEKRYGPEAGSVIHESAKAISSDNRIPDAVKAMVDVSPAGFDLIYALGSKPSEFEEFLDLARRDPAAAIRKTVLIESLVLQELAKGKGEDAEQPKRDETGRFSPPAKKVTEAPPPPREASGRSAPPGDEADSILRATGSNGITGQDFKRLQAIENRKDMARRKGQ